MTTPHPTTKRFSIVVIHRNGTQRLQDFLDSAYSAIDLTQDEIIIVDNHSTDDSLETCQQQFPDCQIIRNSFNTGYSTACNQGIRQSQGEFILLCNNDILLPENLIRQCTDDFTNYPAAGLIGGQLVSPDGHHSRSAGMLTNFKTEMGFKSRRKPSFDNQNPSQVEALYGAFMALRASIIPQTGLLDEDFFFYYEETEWCSRIGKAGYQILFDPKLHIIHTGGASTKGFSKAAAVELFRSRLLYWEKTLTPIQVTLLYSWHIPKLVFDCCFYFVMATLTAGRQSRLNAKLANKLTLLNWLAQGKPESWGLPDRIKPN